MSPLLKKYLIHPSILFNLLPHLGPFPQQSYYRIPPHTHSASLLENCLLDPAAALTFGHHQSSQFVDNA
ncbi:hypothetical protein CISIN_1g035293mg [Citrus sinensis]|uniref:Uncharacterized protein n=1 Tax=Citrus sinensis TaxID=2711 RepID=A0A067GHH4_CITSI|nr:hypothetical protein CISIN_1g035293mg [Citrus sinensis]